MHDKVSFDLNAIPIDLDPINIDLNEIIFQEGEQSMQDALDKPFVGQYFLSEEEAFAFYQNFAKKMDSQSNTEGKQKPKVVDYSKIQRNWTSSRCGCKAYMQITYRRENEAFSEEWQVTILNLEHNHELLSTDEVRFLPSYRSITTEDEKRILFLKEGGLSIRQIMRVMELEKNVSHGQLPFLSKDVRNFLSKVHEKYSHNDAKDLLEYCMKSKIENSNFQYAFIRDDENKLEHIFWSPPQCFEWYKKYGDVVAFDTTYKVNSYDMPFGIFVGIDNNGRTILFGCALLRNETTKTFRWLMEDCFDIPVVYLLSRWSRKEVTLPQEVFENSTSKNNDEV
ncbi:protein FAR1-related sequence 11 [Tanacetum coccineum]